MSAAPLDQPDRDRLVEDLDTTLFVEAGAGTGKTTAVVSRVVALIAKGKLTIERLVAITFTEAAAAELRVRIRQGLEERWQDPGVDEDERQQCASAVAEIDNARIDTIHAFASALLRTWPIEAGLPPDFQVLASIDQDVEFRELIRRWLDDLRPQTGAGQAVGRALLLGLKASHLTQAALALEANHDLITPQTTWTPPPPPDPLLIAHQIGRDLAAVVGLAGCCINSDDRLLTVLSDLEFAGGRLREASSQDAALAALQLIEVIPGKSHGVATNWQATPGIANVCKHIKAQLRAVEDTAKQCLACHRSAALSSVLVSLRDLVLGAVAERRRRGVATFHDLLTWSRDLLRTRPDVLRAAQGRWDRIVVDEFQDTDPLQAELAFLLAADPAQPVPADWQLAPLVPGKLMLVGDPKQSIYRFRRADIAVYDVVRSAVTAAGGETIHLRSNYRSVERVLGWVNHHFANAMGAVPGVQPEYIPLLPHHPDSGTGVWVMGEQIDAKMAEVWQAEADDVAAAARRVVEQGWEVNERGDNAARPRPARYGDICVLIPTRTNLRRLERALERLDVPYQVASGSLIVMTQEVRDLLSCLRAIDDPTDQVALVAALRCPAFGVSDVELLRWRESGGSLDYESSRRSDGERIRAAYDELERLHQLRHWISPAALVEAILEERMLVAAAFDGPRPREVWRRYRYVSERARSFAATGRTTLREFVDWMESLQRDQVRDAGGTSIDADEDAVRILTVHGAKGLEFPVVILTGCGSIRQFRAPSCIADRVDGRVEFRLGSFSTAGYEVLRAREELLDEAEGVRLTYVASTRARDHLIISLHRGKSPDCHAADFVASLKEFADYQTLSSQPIAEPTPVAGGEHVEQEADDGRSAEEEWVVRRAQLIEELRAIDVRSATSLAHERDKDEVPAREEDVAAYRRGRAGTAVGRAVHAVLQVLDLATQAGLDDLARAQAAVEGVSDRTADVVELVRAACASDAVRRAVAGGRYWREVPVAATVDRVLLEGFIDLLYQDAVGNFVVVDYKTDRLTPGQLAGRLEHYRLQGGVYALLVEATTGRQPSRVQFIFASVGATEALPDVAGATEAVHALLGVRAQEPAT